MGGKVQTITNRPTDISLEDSQYTQLHNYLVKTFITEGNLPNLLFYGPPGTGKTSTIVAVAR